MLVGDIMKKPVTVEGNKTLDEAAHLMSSKGVGSLVILNQSHVKGIITERDLLKNFHTDKNVSDIMTKRVITISPDETLEDALDCMRSNKIKRLPVIDESKLVGVITMTDIVAHWSDVGTDEVFLFE